LDSDNPTIRDFLDNMTTADGMTGRQAAGEFVSGVVGELVEGAAEIE